MAIFFIGGASGSGKSSAAKKLISPSGSFIQLDDFHNLLSPHITNNNNALNEVTKNVAERLVRCLLENDLALIVEGGWIEPDIADKLKKEFKGSFNPVFCGYPDADALDRYNIIKNKDSHWLARWQEEKAIKWIQSQIEGSVQYRDACKKFNIPFIDFSDFSNGQKELLSLYDSLYK